LLVSAIDFLLFIRFPWTRPDCYGKDPNRAYTIHLNYDSAQKAEAATWKGVKGCVDSWPCWKGDPRPPALPPSAVIPEDNQTKGSYVLDPKGVEALIIYAVGLLLVVSLILNLKLANRLRKVQQQQQQSGTNGGPPLPGRYPRQPNQPVPNPALVPNELAPSQPVPGAREALRRRQRRARRSAAAATVATAAVVQIDEGLTEPLMNEFDDAGQSQEGAEESKEEVAE
jgi:hypothetical protein